MADDEKIASSNRPDIKTSDEDLIRLANRWMEEAKPFHEKLKKTQDQNEKYYKGDQTFKERVPSDMSNAVLNHIFMGIETIIPIITANPPQFVTEPPEESEVSAKYADALQRVLSVHYETRNVRGKGISLMRHVVLYRLGVWKIAWNETINNCDVESRRPQRIYVPEYGTTVDELPYIIEHVDITYDEFEDKFGAAKLKDFMTHRGEEFAKDKKVKGTATIWEIWTNELVFWKYGGIIIEKRENPFYDFEDEDNNHFAFPRKPYIFASMFRLGNSVIGETDLIQQTIPIQDVINVTTRQIVNNANKMGNAQVLVDSEVMTEEEARSKITNSPGLIIWGAGVANPALFRRDAPPPLPAYIPELKVMAERAFDNIFGTHSTTRGERGQPETLGGRLLLKQADIGRIDLVVREFERCVAELGNWFTQLMRMYYVGKRTFRYYGETGLEFVELSKEMIEKGVKILVKSGTTLPTDEISKRREALELWAAQGLDPLTLFERLKFPNPEKAADRLIKYKNNQLQAEIQAKMAAKGGERGAETRPLISPKQEMKEGVESITGGA